VHSSTAAVKANKLSWDKNLRLVPGRRRFRSHTGAGGPIMLSDRWRIYTSILPLSPGCAGWYRDGMLPEPILYDGGPRFHPLPVDPRQGTCKGR